MKKQKTAVQISIEVRDLLKSYCDKNGYKMSGYVENIILEKINNGNKTLQNVQLGKADK